LNNPVRYIDPFGLDIYRYDKKTGDLEMFKETDDDYDQIAKFKYNKETKKYELKTNKNGKVKTHIDKIEKGILHDGINFMNNDNIFAVGGEGQPSQAGVEKFVYELSEMVGKEIGGAYFSQDGSSNATHISVGKYKDNRYDETKGHGHIKYFNTVSTNQNDITGFFHTHPSSANDRYQPSPKDKRSRDKDLDLNPMLQFFIFTSPKNNGGKIPYIFEYTKWP
jgi:hypothetical protein